MADESFIVRLHYDAQSATATHRFTPGENVACSPPPWDEIENVVNGHNFDDAVIELREVCILLPIHEHCNW